MKEAVYTAVENKNKISLSDTEKRQVEAITMGILEVDENIRHMALPDVTQTLENGHPLNKLIRGREGEIQGYIACENLLPKEAYIKYFGTNRSTGRNLFQEIPAFFEYAKSLGYTKLSFHGWNDKLNNLLQRYGFERVHTDSMLGFSIDFYEKVLQEEVSNEESERARIQAFEDKYTTEIKKTYDNFINTLGDKKESVLSKAGEVYNDLSTRISKDQDVIFEDRQKTVLRLKLARHFQSKDTIDINVLYDALIETPKFINTDKGSLHRLLEVHQEKTLQKVAEIRKRRAEMTGEEGLNPYEALFETDSGDYYMARLLNMPHLEEESEYMSHCVGTSDSYINNMKRGYVEILSFRKSPTINKATNKLEGDEPVMTIEYNLRTKVIEQMKKQNDEYLNIDDPYYYDVINALGKLRDTQTDTGTKRDFTKINESELGQIHVTDDHVLTDKGEIHLDDYDQKNGDFILKRGLMEIRDDMPHEKKVKIVNIVFGRRYENEEVTFNKDTITKSTKAYIGPLSREVIISPLELIATSIDSEPISIEKYTIGGKTGPELKAELQQKGYGIFGQAENMLLSDEFVPSPKGTDITTVELLVSDLGFLQSKKLDEIYIKALSIGIGPVPHDLAAEKLMKDTNPELRIMVMNEIAIKNLPSLFEVYEEYEVGLGLGSRTYKDNTTFAINHRLVFSVSQQDTFSLFQRIYNP